MKDFFISPHFLSSLGLILDIVGVVILFYTHGVILISGSILNTKKQKVGLICLIAGFTLQLLGIIFSY